MSTFLDKPARAISLSAVRASIDRAWKASEALRKTPNSNGQVKTYQDQMTLCATGRGGDIQTSHLGLKMETGCNALMYNLWSTYRLTVEPELKAATIAVWRFAANHLPSVNKRDAIEYFEEVLGW